MLLTLEGLPFQGGMPAGCPDLSVEEGTEYVGGDLKFCRGAQYLEGTRAQKGGTDLPVLFSFLFCPLQIFFLRGRGGRGGWSSILPQSPVSSGMGGGREGREAPGVLWGPEGAILI